MTQIEQILLNRVKLIEDDSWSLIGSPNSLIKELEAIITNQVREARIDELRHIREFWGQAKDDTLSSKPFNFVALYDIDNRIAELEGGDSGTQSRPK